MTSRVLSAAHADDVACGQPGPVARRRQRAARAACVAKKSQCSPSTTTTSFSTRPRRRSPSPSRRTPRRRARSASSSRSCAGCRPPYHLILRERKAVKRHAEGIHGLKLFRKCRNSLFGGRPRRGQGDRVLWRAWWYVRLCALGFPHLLDNCTQIAPYLLTVHPIYL